VGDADTLLMCHDLRSERRRVFMRFFRRIFQRARQKPPEPQPVVANARPLSEFELHLVARRLEAREMGKLSPRLNGWVVRELLPSLRQHGTFPPPTDTSVYQGVRMPDWRRVIAD
jgi:hypothetical protein